MVSYVKLALKGFCMGAADVVPGVSGGTMAFILGIYENLIKAIRSFDLVFFRYLFSLRIKEAVNHAQWQFLLAVGVGILTAIFTLARIISWLLQNKPVLIWSFFFGLVLASILTVTKHIDKWNPSLVISALLSMTGAFFLVGLVPMETPNAPWFLFLSGAVAICAMILPGISGSFILVLMGKYHYVLDAVNNRDLLTLMIVAAGAAIGLFFFSRLLNWLFSKRHDLTIAVLGGLMLGSLRKVWPWKEMQTLIDAGGQAAARIQTNVLPERFDSEVVLAVALAVLGALIVLFLERAANRSEH